MSEVNETVSLESADLPEAPTHNQMVAVQRNEAAQRMQLKYETAQRVMELTHNLDTGLRTQLARFLLDGERDINGECGYPTALTPYHYQAMYDREGAAARVVECEPEETWAMDPELWEDDDPDTDTDFELKWKQLVINYNIWNELLRVDILSGIGEFGVLFLGINDGKPLDQPVDGLDDLGNPTDQNEYQLLFVRPFEEISCTVRQREVDRRNPRYGKPTLYMIHFRDVPAFGIQSGNSISKMVHWTRVIHVADNLRQSLIFGIPRMRNVYNRLVDLRKIYSSSGEAFWKGAFPGMAFEVAPEVADQGVELDKDSIRKEMENYMNGLQRYLALTGVTAKTLPPMLVDPTPSVTIHLQNIAITKGIPYRILFGSEEAKLAATQDSRAWNKRVKKRQDKYVGPCIIRPLVNRLIAFGILPQPKKLEIKWPDLNAPTDQDKATVALTTAQAIQAYISGGGPSLIPPGIFLTDILGMSQAQKDQIEKRMKGFGDVGITDDDEEAEQEDMNNIWEGQLTGAPGSRGNVGEDAPPNVGRTGKGGSKKKTKTPTVPGGKAASYPRSDSQIFQIPGVNSVKKSQSKTSRFKTRKVSGNTNGHPKTR